MSKDTITTANNPLFDKPIILTPEQIKFYADNGYLTVEDALTQSECLKTIEILEFHAQISGNSKYQGVMNLDRPEEWQHVYGPNNHWIHTYIRQMIIKHPVLVTILETLQNLQPGKLVIMQSMFLYKKAQTDYGPQAWNPHQDGCYHGAPYGTTLTGNIALTDQDKENGCMFIYPGSHNVGRFLEARKVQSFHEGSGQRPGHDVSDFIPEKLKGTEVDLHLKQGSILILHGGVIHGSYPNNSTDRDRPMFLAPYKTLGVPFLTGETGKRKEIPIR